MPVSKNAKVNIKNNSFLGNKKRLAIILSAFIVVGVVLLLRSFAATTVVNFNPGDNLTGNAISGFSWKNAKQVSETVQDGKKQNTYNYAEISRNTTDTMNPSLVQYTSTLNPGSYQACVTAKPTSAKSVAVLSIGKAGQGGLIAAQFVQETPPQGYTRTPFALNQFKEVCVDFTVTNIEAGKDLQLIFNAQDGGYGDTQVANTWRVSAITIKLNATENVTDSSLVTAFESTVDRPTFGNDTYGFLYGKQNGKIVTDNVNSVNKRVVDMGVKGSSTTSRGDLGLQIQGNGYVDGKDYRACATLKASEIGSDAYFTFWGGVDLEQITSDANSVNGYVTKCTSYGKSTGGQVTVNFYNKSANGSWRIANVWIEARP